MSFATTFVRATCRANTSQVFGAARTALRTQAPKVPVLVGSPLSLSFRGVGLASVGRGEARQSSPGFWIHLRERGWFVRYTRFL